MKYAVGRSRTLFCPRGHSKADPANQYFNRRRENGKWKAYIECLKCKRGAWKRPHDERLRLPDFSKVPPLAVIADDMPILERWMALKPRRST